jgi:hypothetical protein
MQFCGAPSSVAHVLVRHRMLIFVAKILWSTTHAPQNAYFGAPQKRFSLLVLLQGMLIFALLVNHLVLLKCSQILVGKLQWMRSMMLL